MKRLALVLAASLTAAGCASDPAATAPATKTPVASATTTSGELRVELLTDTRLETGMTPIYVKVTAGSAPVTDADVTFEPMMAMSGGKSHACPVGSPLVGSDGLYHGWANFTMPTSMMGSWSAKVGVTRPGQARVEASFPELVVAESHRSKVFSDMDPDTLVTTRYQVSIRFPAGQKVGTNPVLVTVNRMATMMSFPPVDDATVQVSSWMASMLHAGAGDVDPVLVSSGVYQGTLGFQMSGDWTTTVKVLRPRSGGGTRQIGPDHVFDTTF